MQQDRGFVRNAKWFITICVVVSIFTPFVIQIFFSLNAPLPFFVAQWSAGDMLGYCAGIGGAVATIIAVVMTIREERVGRIETQRLASIPCIALKLHESNENVNDALSSMEGKARFIVVQNGQAGFQSKLNDVQQSMVSGGAMLVLEMGPLLSSVPNPALRYWITMTNAGNGAAINAKAWLDRDGSASQHDGKTLHTEPVQLLPGNSSDFIVLFEDRDDKLTQGDYTLIIDYFDVLGNQYRQSYSISIGPGVPDAKRPTFFDMSIDQQLIDKSKAKH